MFFCYIFIWYKAIVNFKGISCLFLLFLLLTLNKWKLAGYTRIALWQQRKWRRQEWVKYKSIYILYIHEVY